MRYTLALLVSILIFVSCSNGTSHENSSVKKNILEQKETIRNISIDTTTNSTNRKFTPNKNIHLDKESIYKIKLEKIKNHKNRKDLEKLLK